MTAKNEDELHAVIQSMESIYNIADIRDQFGAWKDKLKNIYIRETGDDPWA